MFGSSRKWALVAGALAVTMLVAAVGSTVWPWLLPLTAARVALFSTPTMTARFPSALASFFHSTPRPSATAGNDAPVVPRSLARPDEPSTSVERPRFDVVRVEPQGDVVVAGQAAPGSAVDLLVSGRVVARGQSDPGGHFAVLPPSLAPGDYMLTLRQGNGAAGVESAQSVAVSVPGKGRGSVIVAVAEPGSPSKILSATPAIPVSAIPVSAIPVRAAVAGGSATVPPTPVPSAGSAPTPLSPAKSAAAQGSALPSPPLANSTPVSPASTLPAAARGASGTAPGGLAIRSVELENGHGFYASGAAASGSKLHLYLNGSHLADVVANAETAWSATIGKGMSAGHYVVRVDAAADGKRVTSRVEVPFDVPVAMADPQAAPAPFPAGSQPAGAEARPSPLVSLTSVSTADAMIGEVRTAAVRAGDNLWDISRVRLGQGRRYTRIYAANQGQIRNPRLIYPGQVFVLPVQNN